MISNKYKNILITGGCGFVGSNLAIRLKKEVPASSVFALDNFCRLGSRLNIKRLEKEGVMIIEMDIRDREKLLALTEIDLIIDCAAEPSVLAGRDGNPLYVTDVNLGGTLNTLELARLTKADFVFFSTSRVYPIELLNNVEFKEEETRFSFSSTLTSGISKEGVSEEFPLEGSRTLYGATKLSSELFVKEFVENFGIRAVINRCGVICGPWQFGKVDQGFVTLWLARHFYKKRLTYIGFGGKGKQVRDLLHIDDFADALMLQLADMQKCSGCLYVIGGGLENSVSLQEMTAYCQEVTGNKIEIESLLENRAGDIKSFITDSTLFKKEFAWKPKRDVKMILHDTMEWIRDNEEDLKDILN